MGGRFGAARKRAIAATVAIFLMPGLSSAADHAGKIVKGADKSASERLPLCVSESTNSAVSRLFEKKPAQAIMNAMKSMADKASTENEKDVATITKAAKKANIPLAVVMGILVSPEMGLDKTQTAALMSVGETKLEDIIKHALKTSSKDLTGKEADFKGFFDAVGAANDEPELRVKIAELVRWTADNDIPLGILTVSLKFSDIKERLGKKAVEILQEKVSERAGAALAKGLEEKLERWAPGFEATRVTDLQKFLMTLPPLDSSSDVDQQKITNWAQKIATLAEEHDLTYVLPKVLALENADAKAAGTRPFCLFNGPSATAKRDALVKALNDAGTKDLLAQREKTALGSENSLSLPAFKNALAKIQDGKATEEELRAALDVVFDSLKTKTAGLGDLPDMLYFLKGVQGLKLTDARVTQLEKLFLEKALAESGARLPAGNATLRTLVEELKGENNVDNVPGIVNRIVEAGHQGGKDVANDVKKYLSAGVITMDPKKARTIRQSLARATMKPELSLNPQAHNAAMKIINGKLFKDLGSDTVLDESWTKKAKKLAQQIGTDKNLRKVLEHLLKNGYFTPRQAEVLHDAMLIEGARDVADESAPKRPEAVADPAFLKRAKALYDDAIRRKDHEGLERKISSRNSVLNSQERRGLKEYRDVQAMPGEEVLKALVKSQGLTEFSRAAMLARVKETLKGDLATLVDTDEELAFFVAAMASTAAHTDVKDKEAFATKAETFLGLANGIKDGRKKLVALMNKGVGTFRVALTEDQRAGLTVLEEPPKTTPADHASTMPPTPPTKTTEVPKPAPTNEVLLAQAVGKCKSCHEGFTDAKALATAIAKKPEPLKFLEKMITGEDYVGKQITDPDMAALKAYVETHLKSTAEPEKPVKMTEMPPVKPADEAKPTPESPNAVDKKVVHGALGKCISCHTKDGMGGGHAFAGEGDDAMLATIRKEFGDKRLKGRSWSFDNMVGRLKAELKIAPADEPAFNAEMAELRKFIEHGEYKKEAPATTARPTTPAESAKGTVFEKPPRPDSLAEVLEPALITLIKVVKERPDQAGYAVARDILHGLLVKLKSAPYGKTAEQELRTVLSSGGPEIGGRMKGFLLAAKPSIPQGDPRHAKVDALLAVLNALPAPLGGDVYDPARVKRSEDVKIVNQIDDDDQAGNDQKVSLRGKDLGDGKGVQTYVGVPLDATGKPVIPAHSIVLTKGRYERAVDPKDRDGTFFYYTGANGEILNPGEPILSGEAFSGGLIGLDPSVNYAFVKDGNVTTLQRADGRPNGRLAQVATNRANDPKFQPAPQYYRKIRSIIPNTHNLKYGEQLLANEAIKSRLGANFQAAQPGQFQFVDPNANTWGLIDERVDRALIQSQVGGHLKVEQFKILPPANWLPEGMKLVEGAKYYKNEAGDARTWVLQRDDGRVILYTARVGGKITIESFLPNKPELSKDLAAKLEAHVAGMASTTTAPAPKADPPAATTATPKTSDLDDAAAAFGVETKPTASATTPATSTKPTGDLADALTVLGSTGGGTMTPATTVTTPQAAVKTEVPKSAPAPVVVPEKLAANRVVVANPSAKDRQRLGLPAAGEFYVLTDGAGNIVRYVRQGELFSGSFFGKSGGTFQVNNGGVKQVNLVMRPVCRRCGRRH